MKTKENKAITLIALVVTIILLLILAGTSIAMLTGQNGILNRAQEAKEKTKKAQNEEQNNMTELEAMAQIKGAKVTNPSSYGGNPNAQAIADGTGKYFALPLGAKYITGTVDTGVVVNINGSEFVWVPVDDVVLDKNRVEELPISSSKGILSGKTYTPMAVKIKENYYGIFYEYENNDGHLKYIEDENYQGDGQECGEPYVTSDDTGEYSSQGITKSLLQKEYNEMIESVLKYKGFYIARYEAGLDEKHNVVFLKGNENITTINASLSDTFMWYGLYKKMKTFTTKDDNVVSSMVWGSQYNAMINWMIKNKKIVTDFNEKIANNTNITGNKESDIINNIYDLYGCHYEWTLETHVQDRAIYGGYSENFYSPTFHSSTGVTNSGIAYSSRATLYIK